MSEFERVLAEYKQEFGDDIEADLDLRVGGWDFLARVLLSFVRGNPKAGANDLQRVSRAMRALTGTTVIFPREEHDDEVALLDIAFAHYCDLQQHSVDESFVPRKIPDLARLFAHTTGGNSKAAADRLNRKFKRRKEELMENLDERRVAIEVLQRFALEEIEGILTRFGIVFHAHQ